jgi:hypothetical protein
MTWTAVGPLSTARQSLALATAPAPAPGSGLVLYAIGGDGGANGPAISQVEVFTPAPTPGAWASGPTVPAPALTQLAAATLAGQVHVVGGTRGGPVVTPVATHHIYNPASNSWSSGHDLGTARASHAAVAAPDGYIYAIGGVVDSSGTVTNSVERYNPATDTWGGVAAMPTARQGLAACVLGNYIYAIGGQNPNIGAALTTVEVFNTVSQTWNATALTQTLPQARAWLAASVGPGGLMYAIGGLNSAGAPASDVYGWDGSSAAWATVSTALGSATGRLAAALGPDGRLYAVGGDQTVGNAAATTAAEVFTTAPAQPQPYIGNGTYQSPDIILTDPTTNMPVPLGGQPTGPWDTVLTPNTDYPLSAHIHNDSGVAAPDTVVRFWHFPGGVGSAGTQLSEVVTTIAAGGTTVPSPVPFHSGPAGTHECAVVSLSDAAAPFINVDATTAAQVPDPTVPQPGGTSHYASAWRNTDSMGVGPGHIWHLPFIAATWVREPLPVHVNVTTAKVPVRFEETGEAAKLHEELQFMGAQPHLPLFLAPRVRSGLKPAPELEISVSSRQEKEEFVRLAEDERHELRTSHERPAAFTVRGRIPDDAQVGEAFLVDVGAHYPEGQGRPARTIRWLEVLYVIDVRRRPKEGYGD